MVFANSKSADTYWSVGMLRMQLAVPEQALPHPLNIEPDAGVAVRVTVAPSKKLAAQLPGQLIPAGLLVIDPVPAPTAEAYTACTGVKVAVID